MADNTVLNTGSGGDTISTDDIAGIKVQRVKVQYGADGSATDVATATPLPVLATPLVTTATGNITTQNVAALSLAGTAGSTLEIVINGGSTLSINVTGNWSGANGSLDLQLNFDGTNWISLNATPNALLNMQSGQYSVGSILVGATQTRFYLASVEGAVKARISSTVGTPTGTATVTLMVSPAAVPALTPQPFSPTLFASATVSALNSQPTALAFTAGSACDVALNGAATLAISTSAGGTMTLGLQVSIDGTTYFTPTGTPLYPNGGGVPVASFTGTVAWQGVANVAGFARARIAATAFTSGSTTVAIGVGGPSQAQAQLVQPLPAGTNTIGKVNLGTVGTTAADLAKAEQTAAVSGDTGVFALAVQRAVPASNSATGSYAELQTSPNNGLFVAPTPMQVILTATPTVSSGAIYTFGDVVGAAMTFTGAASATARAGQVTGAVLIDKGKQKAALKLWLFAVSPTLVGADNAVFDITDANLVTALPIGVVDFVAANYSDTASNSVCVGSVNGGAPILPFVTSGSANIFGALSTTGTPTYASTTDLVVYLTCTQF